ncbi:MAG: gamma-glutamyltransferase [Acidobacteria bacterium]|nr:gamma-glutamyltransferase [Acidobacteriota bacterium]
MRRVAVWLCLWLSGALWAQEVSQSGLELKAARPMVSQPERARHAMVASVHELATEVGLEILRRGGNAVDAAVAMGFALAVVHPEAGNLGGGGYILIRMADGRTQAIDYRETAPAAARPGMFQNPLEARVGYKASAVPGTVDGLEKAHRLFGSKPWREVLEPARRLAERGFPASQRMGLILPLQAPVMKRFPETARIFLHGGEQPLKQGEVVRQPDLAATIGRIARRGGREFYEGETARRIAADMEAHGGTITCEDLKGYQAREVEPLRGTYRGHTLLTVPPSAAGGVVLVEMLNILEQFPMRLGMEGSSQLRHLMIEAMKRAYRDRVLHLADPAFHEVPLERLAGKAYAAELARGIRLDRATPSKELEAGQAEGLSHGGLEARQAEGLSHGAESEETTHYSVVDAAGNLVTNTYTLNGFYGSQVIPAGTGVLLNDIMSAFTTRAVSPNGIAPRKRPLSSMGPAIILRPDGSPWVAFGSPGALTISNTLFNITVNLIDFKMSLRDAIEFPRIHHGYQPDRVDAEPGALVFDVAEKLRALGHTLNPVTRSQGDVHAVAIEEGGEWRLGWSDGRRGGRAMGY